MTKRKNGVKAFKKIRKRAFKGAKAFIPVRKKAIVPRRAIRKTNVIDAKNFAIKPKPLVRNGKKF